MPARPRNSLLEQLADLEDPTPKDFDPEDDRPIESDDEEYAEESDGDNDAAAREHYAPVGKSKLRKPEQPSLGPQYAGSRISRDVALNGDMNEDDDDPFAKGFDEEDSEDEDSEDEDSEDEDSEDGTMNGTGSDTEASDNMEESNSDADSDESDSDDQDRAGLNGHSKSVIESVKQSFAQEQKSIAATLSKAAQEDAAKGRAVLRQRAAFDALLGIRIKLQKALIGGNTLIGLAHDQTTPEASTAELDSAFERAEAAAYNLWSGLTTLRNELISARAGSKRSHAAFTADDSTSSLWAHNKAQDTTSAAPITATLEKWFTKTHQGSITGAPKLLPTAQETASSLLADALSDSAHLLRRARTPRSCAPYQLSLRPGPDPLVYDDADMYAVLLATLLDQRGSSAVVAEGVVPHAVRREAKTRKVVDTKASKGRKLRYTVHEKLLNLMAPRDLGTWSDEKADELFSGLFGRRVELNEDDEDDQELEEAREDEEEVAEGALLFGR